MNATAASIEAIDLSPAELRRNREILEKRLLAEIREYELRYELPSADLEAALEKGQIRDTAEVVNWWIAYRALRDMADGRKARPK